MDRSLHNRVVRDIWVLLACAGLLAAKQLTSAAARVTGDDPKAQAEAASGLKANIADLAWLTGHWRGTVGDSITEQICSHPENGEMVCVFRVMDADSVQLLELITIQKVGEGIELRVRHFGLDLVNAAQEDSAPIVLRLSRNTPSEAFFDGSATSNVKRSALYRSGPDVMEGRIDFVNKDGKLGLIQVHWKRVPY
jgi:hypothetical protein